MLYPNAYVWFVFVSALDVIMTWLTLLFGGSEVNPIAALVIERAALPGMIAYKFSIMIFIILVCEIVGRVRSRRAGVWLIRTCIAVSAVPIIWSFILLFMASGEGLEPAMNIREGWHDKPAQWLATGGIE